MLWTITWTGELPQRKTRGYKTDLNVGIIFSFYSDSGFYTVRPVRQERSGKAFVDFIGSSPARKNKIFCFSLAYSKNSLTGGTPHCAKKLYVTFPSDTTDRTFGKPNRTLVPAPMVFRHKTLHLTAELNRQRKYKRKSTTIGSRNIRLISREIDISQIKTNL